MSVQGSSASRSGFKTFMGSIVFGLSPKICKVSGLHD